MRIHPLLSVRIPVFILLGALAFAPTAFASISNEQCIECHDEIDLAAYSESVHGSNACTSCHYDVIDIGVHEGCGSQTQQKVETCHRCHAMEGGEHFASIHMLNDIKCSDCHSKIHETKKWDSNKKSVAETCVGCHDDDYMESDHGVAVLSGNADAPTCSDCHGLHKISPVAKNGTEETRIFHTEICQKCHADREMMAKNNVMTLAVATYLDSYHGKAGHLGSTLAAGCSDCHTGHEIYKSTNPASSVNPENLPTTCGKCHAKSSINFSKFYAHADYTDRENYPVLWVTFILMTSLLLGVFAVFWIHTFLWWRRAYWDHCQHKDTWEYRHQPEIDEPLRPYKRFNGLGKLLHFLMMASFLGLVITGAPLKFYKAPWAHALMDIMGGPVNAGFIHRICAIVTFVYFGIACILVVRYLFAKNGGGTFMERLFGPDSLFPNLRDVQDVKAMLAWFFGKAEEPTFERWTYWEKFDFLAVFWGMFAIGGSGLMLWFPEFFGNILPGWVFNIAYIVHSDEALLASGFIFTVHFFNTHFRPGKFPMDMVIFRGWVPKVELVVERADWVKRLEREGKLEAMKTHPTSPIWELVSQVIGFIAVGIGVICIVLIAWGFIAGGH